MRSAFQSRFNVLWDHCSVPSATIVSFYFVVHDSSFRWRAAIWGRWFIGFVALNIGLFPAIISRALSPSSWGLFGEWF
jgi:hypothetical protein